MHASQLQGLATRLLSGSGLLGKSRAAVAGSKNPSDAKVAKDSTLLFANTLIGAVLGVAFWTIAARLFSLSSVGFNSAVVSTATLVATFANLGAGAVVVRYLPTSGSRNKALSVAATIIPAIGSATIVVAGMTFPYWPLASDLLAGGIWGIALPSMLAITMSVMFVQDSIFIARHEARFVLVRGVGSALARFALLIPLAGAGTYGLMGVFLGGTCVSVALGAHAWFPRKITETENEQQEKPSVREMARYGSTNYFSGLFAQAPQLLYPVLIASQVSHSAAGAFSFAWMAGAMLLQLPPSAANVLMAQLVRHPEDADQRIRRVTRVMLSAMLGLAVIVGVGVALFAMICLPAAAAEITAYLPLLLAGTIPFAWIRLRSMSLSLRGELKKLTILNGIVALFSLALPLVLLPMYGVIGLEAGWVASQALGVVVSIMLAKKPHAAGISTIANVSSQLCESTKIGSNYNAKV